MMKKVRLDQILHRLGYASDEQIKRALIHQKQHGGRLGSNLLEMKYITEQQLTQALSIQYEVPAFFPPPGGSSPPAEVLDIIPAEFATEHLAVPIKHDSAAGSISVVIADPEDKESLAKIGQLSGCGKISVSIAPESVIKKLVVSWYSSNSGQNNGNGNIALPDLFTDATEEYPGEAGEIAAGEADRRRNVLMVSDAVFLRNFLTPIFEREGFQLTMHSEKTDILESLRSGTIDHVLVSNDKSDECSEWLTTGAGGDTSPEVSYFSTVSSALLDNPIPYSASFTSIIRALRIAAEARSAACESPPPYELIGREVRLLASDIGLKRLACDGAQIASLLLVPESSQRGIFADVDLSLEHARALGFPWDIEGTLGMTVNLFSGKAKPGHQSAAASSEVNLCAQIIALVWYRHTALVQTEQDEKRALSQLKTGLRDVSDRIARSEVIESYVRQIEQRDGSRRSTAFQQIFIIGDVDSVVDQLAGRLKHLGYHLVRIYDIDEAARMSERLSPTAVLIDERCYPGDCDRCSELFSGGESVPVFAVTSDSNPSHILDLFDAGFDEVFSPPFDLDVVAARISRTIGNIKGPSSRSHKPGSFSAEFKAFSFIDLFQALGQSLKSIHISLAGNSEKAEIYMKGGRPIFAKCGNLKGVEAIYRIIAWQEDGSFVVDPEKDFPEPNIEVSVESILMEGCRLLDESNA
jgi:type IV pilus assembly protein PilB